MKLNEILNIKYPFIQGGMAHIATGAFAAAVSNAGGLGIIASGGISPESLVEEIKICRSLTDKPFGVNLMLMHRDIDKLAKIVCDYKVDLVTTGAGSPQKYMNSWKMEEIRVFPVVSNKAMAIKMEREGADGIIGEGSEAGGHIGELSTMVLMGELTEAVKIPIIAAGGIGSGKQILASEALGACGVQMGTILLLSEECPIHSNYKNKLLKAKSSMVTVVGRISGLPSRQLKNSMTINYIKREKDGACKEELEEFLQGSLKKAVVSGDTENGSLMCGQIVGSINQIKRLENIFEDLYSDYQLEKSKLCQK